MYRIRWSNPTDIDEISEMLHLLGYPVTPNEVIDRLANINSEDSVTFVAESTDSTCKYSLLGMLSVGCSTVLSRGKRARLSNVIVREEANGLGIGRALVDTAKEFARGRGCNSIELTSQFHRQGAHIFYERLGFEKVSYRFNLNL